jgi:hypothetical protein
MIESPRYTLRPPLRRLEPVLGTNSSQRSNTAAAQESPVFEKLTSPAASQDAATPDASPSRVPPSPPNSISTANAHPERVFFCCVCGKRAVGHVPYGWLRVLRSVHPDSLASSCLLVRRDRRGRAKYADLMVGIFCSADCLEKSVSRLIDLVRDLAADGVGMQPLVSGEARPEFRLTTSGETG